MKPQPCYLRIGNDTLDEAEFCETIAEAKRRFRNAAEELLQYGQVIEASVHFVDKEGDTPVEDMDLALRLGKNGGLISERC